MTNFNINQMSGRAQIFDSLVQLQDGSGNTYRLKSLQTLNALFEWLNIDKYDDAGALSLVRNGQNHTFDMEIVLTNDEADTVNPPTNQQTLSYWIYQKEISQVRVTATVIGKFLTQAAGPNNFVNLLITIDINKIGFQRVREDGVVIIPVSGRITGFTSLLGSQSS